MKKLFTVILALLSLTAFGQQKITISGSDPRTLFGGAGNLGYNPGTGIFYSSSVQNIANLSTVATGSLPDSFTIYVAGFYGQNDGGQSTFIWNPTSTTTTYQGMIVQPAVGGTGRWFRQWDGYHLNILWFGVVGDGSTDNTATIQLAANFKSGTELYVPLPTVSYIQKNNAYFNTFPLRVVAPTKKAVQFVEPPGNNYNGGVKLHGMWVLGNIRNNGGDSGMVFENINLNNQDTTTSVEPNCITIMQDTNTSGITGSHVHDDWFINCSFTGPTTRTVGGVFLDAYRNNFGGKTDHIYFIDCDFYYLYTGINILNTNTLGDTHLNDIDIERPHFYHCGQGAGFSNSLGITAAGSAVRIKVIDPYFHDQRGVGVEMGGPSYSIISGLRMDSSYGTTGAGTQCWPYTFNNINGNGGGPGVGNTATNNQVLDSTNAGPYIYNQISFTSSGNVWHVFNTSNSGSYIPGFASIKNSSFTNDIYWVSNSESNVIPFNFNSYGGTGPSSTYGTAQNNTFTGVQFYGATGDKSLIGFGDSAKNNRFVNCIYGTHPANIVFNDGTAYKNYMDGVDSATGKIYSYGTQTSITPAALIAQEIDSNRTQIPFNNNTATFLSGAGTFITPGSAGNGNYLPILTNASNAGTLVSDSAMWMQSGRNVFIAGILTFNATSGSSGVQIYISAPVASGLVSTFSVSGGCWTNSATYIENFISQTNNKITLSTSAPGTTSTVTVYYHVMYEVE